MSEIDSAVTLSSLSRTVTDDGISVEVRIFQPEGGEGWVMELVEADGGSTTWDEQFVSDTEAWAFFQAGIAQIGLAAFLQEDEEEEPTPTEPQAAAAGERWDPDL